MRAVGFMLLGALIASFAINHDFAEYNEASIAKTKERIAVASQARG